jgi:lipopolysaccharide export system protein LptA
MTGDVVLTQGQSALSSERLVIDLATGTGRLDGRVRTVFRPAGSP